MGRTEGFPQFHGRGWPRQIGPAAVQVVRKARGSEAVLLEPSARTLLAFRGSWENARIEARIDASSFRGSVVLGARVDGETSGGLLRLATDGGAALGAVRLERRRHPFVRQAISFGSQAVRVEPMSNQQARSKVCSRAKVPYSSCAFAVECSRWLESPPRNERMIVTRSRGVLFLALAIPALFIAGAGAGWCLCVDSDGHIALEQGAQPCCPGGRTAEQRAFREAAESSRAREASCCDSCVRGACLDLPPLIGSTLATTTASDAHVLAWAQAQVFSGATLSPKASDAVLASFPGRDRSQRSAPARLFARTISLRC